VKHIQLLTVAALVLTSAPAKADNFFGGRVVESTTFYIGLGFPELEVAAKIPVMAELDFAPRLTMAYGRDVTVGCCSFWLAADFRYRLISDGPLQASLLLSIPFGVDAAGTFGLGLFWPGFAGSYAISASVDLDFGLQAQASLLFRNFTTFRVFLAAFFGLTHYVTDRITVGFRFDGGPDIYAADVINENGRIYFNDYAAFHIRLMAAAGFEF
jgi:hypothetical protein